MKNNIISYLKTKHPYTKYITVKIVQIHDESFITVLNISQTLLKDDCILNNHTYIKSYYLGEK